MVTTVSQLIEETRRLLYGATRLETNRLSGAITNTTTTLITEFDLLGIVRGSYVSLEDEIMYVFNTVTSTKTLTVVRGVLGTTAVAHLDDVLIEVNPRFPRITIKDALKQDIRSYTPKLYRVTAHNLANNSTNRKYDLPDNAYTHIVDVRRNPFTSEFTRPIVHSWYDVRDMDVVDFPNGAGLIITEKLPTTGNLRVRIAREFNLATFADSTDVEATVGLASYMVDIPPYGAAWRLLSAREVPRTNTQAQPEPRLAEEVPAGHISSVVQQLKFIRDERIKECQFRLLEQFPIRSI